jgi:NADH-quinone oxidoreductase subunit J
MELFYFPILFLFVVSGLMVIFLQSPVHSILFLIVTFCASAIILFLFRVEFLAVVFIIIYVGAIAVLFLFVVMMLNVKITKLSDSFTVPALLLIVFLLLTQLLFFFENTFYFHNHFMWSSSFFFDDFSNIEVLGQGLYNNFLICFLLAGFVLLVAIIGAISLTLKFNSSRKVAQVNRQLSRSESFLSFGF